MMLPAKLEPRHVEGAVLLAYREQLLQSLPLTAGGIIAEIGVAFGDFSRPMLEFLRPARFDAYDLFRLHEYEEALGRRTREVFAGRSHRQFYEDRFAVEIGESRVVLRPGNSSERMEELPDETYGLIYVDGRHSYDGVSADAGVAVRKIKRDGVLVFNDYIMFDHIAGQPYGVVHVVNDLCVNHGWRITHFALHYQMFCDVALRRT